MIIKTEIVSKIGEVIRELRLEKNLSQEEFADQCSIHRTYLGCIERGEKVVTINTLKKITDALGLTLTQFFKITESHK